MKIENTNLQEFLGVLTKKLLADISLDCAILFGSRARDNFMPYSDIDMIFVGDFKEKFIERPSLIFEHFDFTVGVGIDAFCYTPGEFKKMFLKGVVSILDAIDHGICIYGLDFYNEFKKQLERLKNKGLKRDPPVWILPDEMTFD